MQVEVFLSIAIFIKITCFFFFLSSNMGAGRYHRMEYKLYLYSVVMETIGRPVLPPWHTAWLRH